MDCSESDSEDDEGGEQCGDPEGERPWLEDPTYRTRPNTPTKHSSRSNCWHHALRLGLDHPMIEEGYTHICAVQGCGHFYKLTKLPKKNYWSNNNCLYHLKKMHGGDAGAWTIKADLEAQVRVR
jgi:hypothetical protein